MLANLHETVSPRGTWTRDRSCEKKERAARSRAAAENLELAVANAPLPPGFRAFGGAMDDDSAMRTMELTGSETSSLRTHLHHTVEKPVKHDQLATVTKQQILSFLLDEVKTMASSMKARKNFYGKLDLMTTQVVQPPRSYVERNPKEKLGAWHARIFNALCGKKTAETSAAGNAKGSSQAVQTVTLGNAETGVLKNVKIFPDTVKQTVDKSAGKQKNFQQAIRTALAPTPTV